MFDWTLNQVNEVKFVMVDANYSEVPGIGDGNLTVEVSKPGDNAFVAALGTNTEIGSGWYRYLSVASEADSVGIGAIKITGAGAIQQNIFFKVKQSTPGAIAYTYTVTDSVTGDPVEGVGVWITSDIAGNNVVWKGTTDALGVARDDNNSLPYLDAGTYYLWKQKSGFIDAQGPDTEIIS